MDEELARMRSISNRLIERTPMEFRRSLCSKIDWANRLICIKGARGTGKSTLLQQHIKETFGHDERAFYVSFDHYWFKNHSPMEFVEEMHKQGVSYLFIDEVHHLCHWQSVIKNINDFYPEMTVAYSGSSLLKMDNQEGDLSRRQIQYELKGLSFREFLHYEGIMNIPPVKLDDILTNHVELASGICAGTAILPLFEKYIVHGFYPYYKSESSGYQMRLMTTVDKILDSDYPAVEEVTTATIRKTKKMLAILATSCPQQPNMSRLYSELETDRNQGLKMLSVLERAGLVMVAQSEGATLKNLSRPEKIYCDNTNIMHAFMSRTDVGTLRETFFLNQIRASGHSAVCPSAGDFKVDGRLLFEIGGAKKRFSQIKDIPGSYVVSDNIETGYGNRIPLWLFGFLY